MTNGARQRPAEPKGGRGANYPERKLFHILATEHGVRTGLRDIRRFLDVGCYGADANGTAEIVLAEALNNIAEHAFATARPGIIRVTLTRGHRTLTAEIADSGDALPGLCPPCGQLPSLDGAMRALPEGGFGWFLIRSLTDSLSYTRCAAGNHLCLSINFAPPDADNTPPSG